ncbi:MAG: ribonuclease [Bacteroidetes bacterium]|nr:ribonuclease [Bacteroidota bacterium]
MNKLIVTLKYLYNFVLYDIWRITGNELSNTRRFFYNIIKTIFLAFRGYIRNKLGVRAAALTYSITFAIVPLIALIVAVAKGFGIEKYIEEVLQDTFIAQANLIPTVMRFVEKYLETMQGGVFLGVGVIILLYSVMNLFIQVELTLNNIWQVQKSRSFLKQFTTFFTGIFLFPILLALTSGLSIYINGVVKGTFIYQIYSPLEQISVVLIPYLTSIIMFTVIYMIVPNTKVHFYNALIAGFVAGIAFQLFQTLYVNGQISLTRYNAVYGGFAAIPLLLLWINISSLIFLIGAEISYVSQNLRNFDYEVDTDTISNRYKSYLTIFVAYIIVKQFEMTKPPLTVENIVSEYKLPIRLLNQIITILTNAGIIIAVRDDKNETSYQPAIDINQLTLNMMYSKIDMKGSELFLKSKNEEMDVFWQKMLDIQAKSDKLRENILLKDI